MNFSFIRTVFIVSFLLSGAEAFADYSYSFTAKVSSMYDEPNRLRVNVKDRNSVMHVVYHIPNLNNTMTHSWLSLEDGQYVRFVLSCSKPAKKYSTSIVYDKYCKVKKLLRF